MSKDNDNLREKTKMTEKIECKICGCQEHVLQGHLRSVHSLSIDDYLGKFEGAAVLSGFAQERLAELEKQSRNELVDFDIKTTFGFKINDNESSVQGYKHAHQLTPELDPDYKFRKGLLALMVYAVRQNLNGGKEYVLFSGPTGSGKSTVVMQFFSRLNWPLYRVNMDGDITRADFVGQWTLKGEEMEFIYGALPRAMKSGTPLLIDEWDMGNPSVMEVLKAVLEGNPLFITETGETIKPAKGFMIFATANTLGQGDETGLYNGVQPQNYAQLDRFDVCDIVDYPTKADERAILQKKCGFTDTEMMRRFGVEAVSESDNAKALLDKVLEVSALVRKAFKKEEIMATMSTRTNINICNKMLAFGDIRRAYEIAYTNKLNGDDKQFVSEIIQRVWAV
jgi:cobaltochelatase CobS